MTYIQHYDAPLGRILLAADEVGLTGLWFDGAKYFADGLPAEHTERETPVLSEARRWLDLYFAGRELGFLPPLHPAGSAFQQAVCGAVGHNKISIIIPCHRVVGTGGSLTGYAGGIDRKVKLLALEQADMTRFFVPKTGTALL